LECTPEHRHQIALRQDHLAGCGRADGADQLFTHRRDPDDLRLRTDPKAASRGLDPVHARKIDVHQHDVRSGGTADVQRLLTASDRGRHLDGVLDLEQRHERIGEHLVLVDVQHPDRWRHAAPTFGGENRNVVRTPGTLSAEIEPPCASTIPLQMYNPSPAPGSAAALPR
jgi:hypothetical protein